MKNGAGSMTQPRLVSVFALLSSDYAPLVTAGGVGAAVVVLVVGSVTL
jgi:hypothetical protein